MCQSCQATPVAFNFGPKGRFEEPHFQEPTHWGREHSRKGGRWNPYVTSQLGGFVNPKTLLVLVVVAFELRWWKFLFLSSSFSVFLYTRIQEFRSWFWVVDRLLLVVVVIFGFAKELLFEAPFACCTGYGISLSISYLCAVSIPP